MSGISTRGVYGLAAMFVLAKNTGKTMQIKEISKEGHIPQSYLEQILATLRKNGLIQSIRGAQGGYLLALKPGQITIYQILECLEGSLYVTDSKSEIAALNLFWEDVQNHVQSQFELTLAELLEYQDKANQEFNYSI